MEYFRNSEVAKMFKVSKATVGHWVQAAETKEINLELIETNNKKHIANNPQNFLVLKGLSDRGRKFKNKKAYKVVKPLPEFYSTYNELQIIDIITNLDLDREIPHKYCYFSSGAKHWDDYINRNIEQKTPITINRTIETLRLDREYLDYLIKGYKVNLIDIGPGNALPVKELVEHLIQNGQLRKYIGIDISDDMLKVTEANLKQWFGESFHYEGHAKDITNESIQELLYKNTHNIGEDNVINLVLFIGSTIENQRKYDTSLNIIKESLGRSDIFVLGQLLDTEESRIHLSFNPKSQKVKNADIDWAMVVLNLLNIDDSLYEMERTFDEKSKARVISIVLKYDLDVMFETPNFKHTVKLQNKEKIIIFRHNHHTTFEVIKTLHDIGFGLLHATISEKQEQAMFMFKRRMM